MRRFLLMPHVRSQAIRDVEYDAARRWLFVQFSSGEWYAYLDVQDAVFTAFLAAPSKGRFFQDRVRDHYAHEALPQPAQRPVPRRRPA